MRALLAIVLLARVAQAIEGPASVTTYQSGVLFSDQCQFLDFTNTGFVLTSLANGGCQVDLISSVTKLNACIGEVADWCGSITPDSKIVDLRNVTAAYLPEVTSLSTTAGPNSSACVPSTVARLKGTGTTPDRLCTCAWRPCAGATECGTSGACSSNRCTAGTTSTAWQCVPALDPRFGDGADGVFDMPVPTGGTTCSVGSTPSTGAVCPSTCATCTNVTGGDATAGCICALTINSERGRFSSTASSTSPSVLRRFTRMFVGKKNRVTVNRTVGACAATTDNGTASELWFQVQGDLVLEGDGTNGAKLDMKGKGACGGNATNFATGAGVVGASFGLTGAGAGGAAGAKNAGSNGVAAIGSWFPGEPTPFLYGPGGARAPASTGTVAIQSYAVLTHALALYGSGSGGSGSCFTSVTGCTTSTGGDGGGAVILDVGGTLDLQSASRIDTSGNAAGGNAGGGGGGGGQLLRYRALSEPNGSSHYVAGGGAGGTSCGTDPNGCGAGGNGGAGLVLKVAMP